MRVKPGGRSQAEVVKLVSALNAEVVTSSRNRVAINIAQNRYEQKQFQEIVSKRHFRTISELESLQRSSALLQCSYELKARGNSDA